MNENSETKPGDKTSLYCPVCGEERTFAWTGWSATEYYGYRPERRFGWECSVCGSRVFPV